VDQHDLKRTLTLFPATNVVVANMIGAGIFTTSGLLLAELGDPVLMLALWAAGGVLALCGALCYGALGAAMPRAGGEYVYLSRLFHPLLGFLTGWVSVFVGFSAPLAASALGFSEYAARAVAGLTGSEAPAVAKQFVAVAAIVALTLVHLRGVAFGARVQNILTVGKVVLIAGLIAAGLALGQGDLGHFQERAATPAEVGGWKTVGLSLMWIMFAYSGWNASAYVGAEIRRPERTLPWSLVLGTGVVTLLYLGLNVLFVYAAPPADQAGVIAVGGLAASRLFGPGADVAVALLIAVALLSSISALIMIGPRVYYAMAQDGLFFRGLSAVHPRFQVPARSILLQAGLAIVMVLSGTFDQILTYMGFCLGIFPLMAAAGVFRLRRTGMASRPPLGHPVVPLVFIAGGVAILVLGYLERPLESSVAVATVAAGVPFYVVFRRLGRRGGSSGRE